MTADELRALGETVGMPDFSQYPEEVRELVQDKFNTTWNYMLATLDNKELTNGHDLTVTHVAGNLAHGSRLTFASIVAEYVELHKKALHPATPSRTLR